MDIFKEMLSELAKNSPMYIPLIAMMILCFFMYKHSVKVLRESFYNATQEINKSHSDAVSQLRENLKLLMDHQSKFIDKVNL